MSVDPVGAGMATFSAVLVTAALIYIAAACGFSYEVTVFPADHRADLANLENSAASATRKLGLVCARNPAWINQGETVGQIVHDVVMTLRTCGLDDAARALSAVALGRVSDKARSPDATDGSLGVRIENPRKRAINAAVRSVAELLGNTLAGVRCSYIDPRVFDRYLSGWTIAGALQRIPPLDVADDRVRTRVERAVLELLDENTESSALEPVAA